MQGRPSAAQGQRQDVRGEGDEQAEARYPCQKVGARHRRETLARTVVAPLRRLAALGVPDPGPPLHGARLLRWRRALLPFAAARALHRAGREILHLRDTPRFGVLALAGHPVPRPEAGELPPGCRGTPSPHRLRPLQRELVEVHALPILRRHGVVPVSGNDSARGTWHAAGLLLLGMPRLRLAHRLLATLQRRRAPDVCPARQGRVL
mmetsp:Transcript_62142/g.180177  ORF Transcript_62142/g.180177 Transcript_62142/m.180177 type:complete len:207 (+) Transcript_62142:591-1211(+)